MSAWGEADWTAHDLSVEEHWLEHWLDDPERFVKPDPFRAEPTPYIVDRDPGDEDDNREAPC